MRVTRGTRRLSRRQVQLIVEATQRGHAVLLNTIWRTREDLDRMRASGVKPKGVQMFEAVGASPVLAIFEVVVHRAH